MNENPYAPPVADVDEASSGRNDASSPRKMLIIRRCFAVALLVGGTCGIGIALYLGYQNDFSGALILGFVTVFLLLFSWATFVGFRLWQGTAFGLKWAPVVFASQVPLLTIPGFTYGWFTGCTLAPAIMMGAGKFSGSLSVDVGANVQLAFGYGAPPWELGINLFALAACLWLLRLRKASAARA